MNECGEGCSVTNTVPRFVRRFLVALLAVCGTVFANDSTGRFDIPGFRLGMTPDEVEAVFVQRNPDVDLKTDHRYFRYSEGLQDHQRAVRVDRLRVASRLACAGLRGAGTCRHPAGYGFA
jgi:hypothetical protein